MLHYHHLSLSEFPLGTTKQSFYQDFIEGCRDFFGKEGERCGWCENDRIGMNLNQPSEIQNFTTAMMNNAVSLRELLDGKKEPTDLCVQAMRRQGWVLVRLPASLRKQATTVETTLSKFFESPPQGKLRFGNGTHLGYNSDPNRQSLRLLTGTELNQIELPQDLLHPLKKLATTMDEALRGITNSLSEPLFGKPPEKLARDKNLPFLSSGSQGKGMGAFALFEAAYYNNNNNGEEEAPRAENCAAHFDPGLFSLNVLSNQPGLEFLDHDGNWVPAPLTTSSEFGVLWTGAAAFEAAKESGLLDVKVAMHRVTRPQEKDAPPRLSVWSEICTREQVFLEEVVQTEKAKKLVVKNMFDDPYSVPLEEGGVLEALGRIQIIKGLPMSKAIWTPVDNEDDEVIDLH